MSKEISELDAALELARANDSSEPDSGWAKLSGMWMVKVLKQDVESLKAKLDESEKTVNKYAYSMDKAKSERDAAEARLAASKGRVRALGDALRVVNIRIHLIGMPQEPMYEFEGRKIPDWSKATSAIGKALDLIDGP